MTARRPASAAISRDLAIAKAALEEIVDPIRYMRERAKAEGKRLIGTMAVHLANDVYYRTSIAKKALALLSDGAEPKTADSQAPGTP